MPTSPRLDWADLAFSSKEPVNKLRATFIVAPRELTMARFTQLVKAYLPKGNIILGLAKEPFVLGLEDQPQFRMLRAEAVQPIIDKVNAKSPHKMYTLEYFQRELPFLLEKLDFRRVVLVNGSWHRTFHTLPAYYVLANRRVDYDMVSPFASEAEAREFEARVLPEIEKLHPLKPGTYTEIEMLGLAAEAATFSYDNSFQTGVALGKKSGKRYKLLATAFNKVVPFQTYAMHYGASRERHFSPPHDLNHYDTVHAEVEFIIKAGRQKIDLRGTTLFINLLPCPACARMFSETDIEEFVYRVDHSSGYAVEMLQKAGKKVRRLV